MRHSPVFEFNQNEDDVLSEAIDWNIKQSGKNQTINEFTKEAVYRYAAERVNAKRRHFLHRALREEPQKTARLCANCSECKKGELHVDRMKRKKCQNCFYVPGKPNFTPRTRHEHESNGLSPRRLPVINCSNSLRCRGHE